MWGLLLVGAAGACASSHDPGTKTDDGAGGDAQAGRNSHQQAGDASEAGATNGASSQGGTGTAGEAGSAVGDCTTTWSDAGGAGGAPGCLTLTVPETPFLLNAMPDPGYNVCQGGDDCQIGPWLMAFHTLPDGDLEGALVSTKRELWPPDHDLEAAAFRLHAEGGVYRLPARTRATLATYGYDEVRVPGVCLAGKGLAELDAADRGAAFSFFDDTGDGVADGVALSGSVLSLGQRGGDYDDNCGNESYPLQTQGHTVEANVHLSAEGGVLKPRLIADGGFLKHGSAWVQGPQGMVEAQALTLSGFTYGYAADVVLQPAASLSWKIDAVDWFDNVLQGPLSFGQSEPWPQVHDGSFESYGSGEEWSAEDASVEGSCNPSRLSDEAEVPPVAGARSLVIDANGYRDRFRFTRTAQQTKLSFVALGSVKVQLATVGARGPTPLPQTPVGTPADCQKYAAFCAQVPVGLKHYSIDLPAGTSDVLVRLYNGDMISWSTGVGSPLCVDDLNLE